MNKAIILSVTVLMLMLFPTAFLNAAEMKMNNDTLQSASIVIDAESGAILAGKDQRAARYPASLTKMMSLYLLFEAIEQGKFAMDDRLTVSENARNQQGCILNFKPGDVISIQDAILALAVKSANDVAVVIAEKIAGSESVFADKMTQKARKLGMAHTVFKNASGWFNKNHKTTALDMAILLKALYTDFPHYYPYLGKTTFSFKGKVYENGNKLLGQYPGMDGSKTGFISKAGYCVAASAERSGHRLIAVVLGEKSEESRNIQIAKLLDAAFSRLD